VAGVEAITQLENLSFAAVNGTQSWWEGFGLVNTQLSPRQENNYYKLTKQAITAYFQKKSNVYEKNKNNSNPCGRSQVAQG